MQESPAICRTFPFITNVLFTYNFEFYFSRVSVSKVYGRFMHPELFHFVEQFRLNEVNLPVVRHLGPLPSLRAMINEPPRVSVSLNTVPLNKPHTRSTGLAEPMGVIAVDRDDCAAHDE